MEYFSIETCPAEDVSLAVLRRSPDGTIDYTHRLARGFAMGDLYPSDAKWHLSAKDPGIKLASLIASTNEILVVRRELKDVFAATGAPMECLPFTLYDHKKRVASRDYFIVNPLAILDCLNLQKSEISWSEDGKDVIHVYEHVLDPRKLGDAPAVFRVREDRECVVLTDGVAARIEALSPTNVFLTKLLQEA